MPVKKYCLGLQDPVTSANDKYLGLLYVSRELIGAVTGARSFSTANRLLGLREERCHGQKIQDDANEVKPKGLDDKLEASDRRLILRAKNASSYMTVRGTIVTGTVFVATEFCAFFVHVVMLHPPNL